MTRVGEESFLACPGCGAVGRGYVLLSYSCRATRLRTDGVAGKSVESLSGFALPFLTRCRECSEVFFPSKAESVAPTKGVPHFAGGEEEEYLEALERGLFESRKECLVLRLSAWRFGNDRLLREEGSERSLDAQRNLDQLFLLLDATNPEHLVLKAEVARHQGRFAEALALLDLLPRLQRSDWTRKVRGLAEERTPALALLPYPSVVDPYLRCPECGVGSRTRAAGSRRVPDHGRDQDRSRWVASCRDCSAVFWAGAEVTQVKGGLLRVAFEFAAGLGCLGSLALGVLAAVIGHPFSWLFLGALAGQTTLLAGERWLHARRWPWARLPSERELLDCIDRAEWTSPAEERWVRVAAWSLACQPEGGGDMRAEPNRIALQELLGDDDESLLIQAEFARRAGRFDEAASRLAWHLNASWDPRVKRSQARVEAKDALSPPDLI